MKFGQNLHRHQAIEWAPFYIAYQALKPIYNELTQSHGAHPQEDADLSGLLKIFVCPRLVSLIVLQVCVLAWSSIRRE